MSEELTKEKIDQIYEVIEIARSTGKIKKGTNEATKAAEKGTAKLVAYAKDVNPQEVVMHIPLVCKDKGVPCFGVPSREELGTAAGLVVPTSAVAVTDEGNAKKLLAEVLKGKVVKPVEEKAESKEEKVDSKEEKADVKEQKSDVKEEKEATANESKDVKTDDSKETEKSEAKEE
ncbi:MAG: ribosomal L7Ae/L30e/S12e/Gadd45 family protein [Candidatus Woesearchaeota archaeon]